MGLVGNPGCEALVKARLLGRGGCLCKIRGAVFTRALREPQSLKLKLDPKGSMYPYSIYLDPKVPI